MQGNADNDRFPIVSYDRYNDEILVCSTNSYVTLYRYRNSNGTIILTTPTTFTNSYTHTAMTIDNIGSTYLALSGFGSPFLLKYSVLGVSQTFPFAIPNTNTYTEFKRMVIDNSGSNIYLSYKNFSSGGGNSFTGICKSSTSNVLWSKGFQPNINAPTYSNVLLDEANNTVYWIGDYSNIIDITGIGQYLVGGSIFLAKFDMTGIYGWSGTVSTGNTLANSACTFGQNVFIGGTLEGTSNFNTIGASYNLTSSGNKDAFLAKYGLTNVAVSEVYLNDNLLSVFPNPLKDNFNILLNKEIVNGNIQVFNVLGNIVYSSAFSGNTAIVNVKLDKGVYFLSITEGYQILTRKIVVN